MKDIRKDAERVAVVLYAVTLSWMHGRSWAFAYTMAGRRFGLSASTVRRWHHAATPLNMDLPDFINIANGRPKARAE